MRARRGLFTRWELGILLVALLVVGAWTTQEVRLFRLRTARAEVGMMLTALRMHLDDVERPRSFGPTPRAPGRLGTSAVPWAPDALPGFEPPLARVRGAYRLRAGDPGMLEGWIDADGDGEPAHYRLPLVEGELERRTGPSVY